MTDLAARPRLRSVALPTEHGGWGLTLEPVLLGLLVSPSVAGLALGTAALTAFLARTPLKLVLVDWWRGRRLPRTVLALKVAAAEIIVVALLLAVASAAADTARFWVPLALAIPLFAMELWFDMRSRSRRLLPELAGTVGIGSIVAAIVLAGGDGARLAAGLWLVVAARAIASLPFVRLQLARFKGRPHRMFISDVAQGAAVACGLVAVIVANQFWVLAVAAIAAVAVYHLMASRREPPVAAVLGAQEMGLGLLVVLATAIAVWVS